MKLYSLVPLFLLAVFAPSLRAQTTTFRYLYDDAGELYRVLDSTGTLIEYTYDPSGNITKVNRSTVPASQLSILNVTPSSTITAGSAITIVGQNFSALVAGDVVTIGGVRATVISATATQLVVRVPSGTAGGVVSVTVGGVTATWSNTITIPVVYDLSSNWSNARNPNGPWSYNQGSTPLPFVPNWNASNSAWQSSCGQPAWAPSNSGGNFLPPFLELNACAAHDPNFLTLDPNNDSQPNVLPGDVIVHTVDSGNGNPSLGVANILYTAPASGVATIGGSLWDADLGGTSSSRPQDWYLLLNGTQIATGRLSGAVSRSQSQAFSVVENLNVGDRLELEIEKDPAAPYGFFVGINLTITQSFTPGTTPQSITFGPLSSVLFGVSPFALSATATSGLPVGFASTTTGACTVAGIVVTVVGVGTCSITASQPGSATYSGAAPVTQSFTVNQGSQTITFGGLSGVTFGVSPFALSATATSGLPVSFTSTTTGVCTVAGIVVTLVGAGTCSITASQPGNATYSGAAPVTQSFTVNPLLQTITFGGLSSVTFGVSPFALSATATSGLPVSFTSTTTGVCTVAGIVVTLVGAGTCSITASQAGSATYSAAAPVTQSFTVNQGSQTITFDAIPNQIFGGSPFQVAARASSGLPVGIASITPTVCKTASDLVMLLKAGTCSITASQSGYNPATSVTRSFTVSSAKPSVGFTAALGSPFSAGTASVFVVTADFNGDGIPDLAAANAGGNNVTVLLGNGSGGFTAATGSPFAVGTLPISLAVGDFNGDGIQDLAIANLKGNNVTVLLGNGSGVFTAATGSPFNVGAGPYSVVVGDFNGDGIQDLSTANLNSNNVTVLLGNGSGGFTAAPGSPVAVGTNPYSVVVGDFNGDGIQDLATANANSSNVTVLLGNGSGGFTAAMGSPVALVTGLTPVYLVVGDFNGDGIQDLAALDYFELTVLLGNGAGQFTATTGSPFLVDGAVFSYSLVLGDFNGDGIQDLAVANQSSNTITVLLGNGLGGFTAAPGSPFPVGTSPYSVVVGDFNGDGIQDLATANDVGTASGNVTVLLGQGAVPAVVSANASASPRPLPANPSPGSPVSGLLPVLEPLGDIMSVTVGETIRLNASNVDPGSVAEFDVNRANIATVSEAPYETLFTVPDGPAELVFQVFVRTPGQPERLSQITRMMIVPDSGANIPGSVPPETGRIELSLAASGLKAEFFHLAQPATELPSLDGALPVRSGYVTAINEPNPGSVFGDDPLGVHLGSDYAIRFSGEVRADEPGIYQFWLTARSGAAILIDGKPLANTGFASVDPVETAVSIELDRGWHSIEVIYYLAVGASSVRLDWQPPNSSRREVLGPEYLRTVLSGMTTVSAADGTFAFPQVPKKFDTVWIRANRGDGFIESPPVKPGSGPISIAVPR